MNKVIKKAGILLGVFIAATAGYFIWTQKTVEKGEIVYTALEEATLPVVYAELNGRKTNEMHGYIQDMGESTARDILTVLPEDRRVVINIEPYGEKITGVHYEIRSLNLERLVERNEAELSEDRTSAVLPLQNLLENNTQYYMNIILDTQSGKSINYYTRIVLPDNQNIQSIIDFAVDFTTRTFDYNQARELVTYLETNSSEDNSSLGHVTIRSSFSQLTWGEMGAQLASDISINIKEADGIMSVVQLEYIVNSQEEDGNINTYETVDSYTVKWTSQRIYLMDFDRKTNQIFSGSESLFSGKRIITGIGNDETIRTRKSESGIYNAFVTNRDLWCYDRQNSEAVRIFSFRSRDGEDVRSNYRQHDIKILSVDDNGDISFIVYGYMNRGEHEGMMGVSLFKYEADTGNTTENFFAPVKLTFQRLKADLENLSYIGNNEMLYLYIDHALYGVDLRGNEYVVVADNLQEGEYAISQDGRKFAWQDSKSNADVIHLLDLDSGQKHEINAGNGKTLRTLGFVGNDFIYGIAYSESSWVVNERIEAAPMHAIEIINDNLQVETHYEKEDIYISSVEIQDSRIQLNRVVKISEQNYVRTQNDTLVCNAEISDVHMEGIGWYASPQKRKTYFVQLDSDIPENKSVNITSAKKISYENSKTVSFETNNEYDSRIFYAYAGGDFMGNDEVFSQAVAKAYDRMGIVINSEGNIVWSRVNRRNSRTLNNADLRMQEMAAKMKSTSEDTDAEEGGYLQIIDAKGCSLNQVLYFIDNGYPVIAYEGNEGYVLITGYDSYNITLSYPESQSVFKMGLKDATEYFDKLGNDFICGVFVE